MKIDIVLQARSTSTRLPKKIYKPLNGKTMLEQIVHRLKQVSNVNHLCVATIPQDLETIQKLLKNEDCLVLAGSENNVLERFIKAGKTMDTDIMIRTTADNPFVDFVHLEEGIKLFSQNYWDYFGYTGLPYGAGFEIFQFSALEKAYIATKEKFDLEHVTPYIYNHKDKFRVELKNVKKAYFCPELRVTVDTLEDYERAKKWYRKYWNKETQTSDLRELIQSECSKKT